MFQCASGSLQRTVFQACSFNHSAISPFRINQLRGLNRAKGDCAPNCALTLPASPHILADYGLSPSQSGTQVHGRDSVSCLCLVWVKPLAYQETSEDAKPMNSSSCRVTWSGGGNVEPVSHFCRESVLAPATRISLLVVAPLSWEPPPSGAPRLSSR